MSKLKFKCVDPAGNNNIVAKRQGFKFRLVWTKKYTLKIFTNGYSTKQATTKR
jgi:hypothetical protein